MMESLSLKVSNLPMEEWHRAHRCAMQYLRDFPNRRGIRDGCVYTNQGFPSQPIYVYRTKTQIVVRGSVERTTNPGGNS